MNASEMENLNIDFSMKDILITSIRNYIKHLIGKVNDFIHRIRWKVFFFDNRDNSYNENIIWTQTISKIFQNIKEHRPSTIILSSSKVIFRAL